MRRYYINKNGKIKKDDDSDYLKIFGIIFGIIVLLCIISSFAEDVKTQTSSEPTETQQEQIQEQTVKKQNKRLSIEEQEQDEKGTILPISMGYSHPIDDVVFSQIYGRKSFYHSTTAYYVDRQKYPNFYKSIKNATEYASKLAEQLAMYRYDDKDSINIFIYSYVPDLYYTRDIPFKNQLEMDIEFMKLKPAIHVNYTENVLLEMCVWTDKGYRSYLKYSPNDVQWVDGGGCGINDLEAWKHRF